MTSPAEKIPKNEGNNSKDSNINTTTITTTTTSCSTSGNTNNDGDKNGNKTLKSKPNYRTNDTTELLRPIPNQVIEKKFDDIIESVIQVDNTCCYTKCKQKTNLMGVDCQFCKNKYCFKHGLPEVHGCGAAVKIDERKKFLHPVPEKTKRQQAELKKAHETLNTKLKEMQISRLPKSKKNNGSSKKSKTGGSNNAGTSRGSGGGGGDGTSSGGTKKKN